MVLAGGLLQVPPPIASPLRVLGHLLDYWFLAQQFEVSYDSDGLLSISDPVQETLSGLIKTHREEVESLRKELCITRQV